MVTLALALAQSAALTAPSADQTPPVLKELGLEVRTPPTAAEIEAARAEANQIAAAAGAQAFFDNVTTDRNPALKHKASGLVCKFAPRSSLNKVLLFRPPGGDSIGCNTGASDRSVSVFLDRAPAQRPPIERLAPALAKSIVQRFPEAMPSKIVMVATGKDGIGRDLPPHRVAQFSRPSSRGDIEERLAAGYAGDWFLQLRITEPAANSVTADLFNEMEFLNYQRMIIAASAGRSNEISSDPPH